MFRNNIFHEISEGGGEWSDEMKTVYYRMPNDLRSKYIIEPENEMILISSIYEYPMYMSYKFTTIKDIYNGYEAYITNCYKLNNQTPNLSSSNIFIINKWRDDFRLNFSCNEKYNMHYYKDNMKNEISSLLLNYFNMDNNLIHSLVGYDCQDDKVYLIVSFVTKNIGTIKSYFLTIDKGEINVIQELKDVYYVLFGMTYTGIVIGENPIFEVNLGVPESGNTWVDVLLNDGKDYYFMIGSR